MKLLGWTIVASGLILGIAACTVTTDDPATTDGGTGGTAGAGGSTAGAGGSTAGAGGSTAGSAGTAGTAGAAGAAGGCTTEGTTDCDKCAVSKCCDTFTKCDENTVCQGIMTCADLCWSDPDSGVTKYSDCITGCANGAGSPPEMDLLNDYYTCLCLSTTAPDGCQTECEAAQMCP
jgi:hypothetical protein